MIYLNYVISNRSILDIRIDNLLLPLILWNIGLIPRFSVIDPDYQYYTNLHQNGNLNCDYYYEDTFRVNYV